MAPSLSHPVIVQKAKRLSNSNRPLMNPRETTTCFSERRFVSMNAGRNSHDLSRKRVTETNK
jgi:hypothetical protein